MTIQRDKRNYLTGLEVGDIVEIEYVSDPAGTLYGIALIQDIIDYTITPVWLYVNREIIKSNWNSVSKHYVKRKIC